MIKSMLLAFIPLFVAVDALGVLPIFFSLTDGVDEHERRKAITYSMFTAIFLTIGFIFLGKAIFKLLNITMGDFMVAGGIVLFCIALIDIVNPGKKRRLPGGELGVVPLGTPLIAGPAVLTTSLIIMDQFGLFPTLVSVVGNILFAGIIFLFSGFIIKGIGVAGARALSKVASLLLAAIAVMMIRKGITYILLP